MLGRKKKAICDLSFLGDALAGMLLLAGVYFFLRFFREDWQSFLQQLTGYPFQIQPVTHLSEQIGWFVVILASTLLGLRVTGFYRMDLFAPFPRVVVYALRGVFVGIGLAVLVFYFLGIIDINRSLLFGFAGVFMGYLVPKEVLLRRYLRERYFVRHPDEALLVCPSSQVEARLAEFNGRQFSSTSVRGVVLTDEDAASLPEAIQSLRRGRLEALAKTLSEGHYDRILLCDPPPEAAQQVLRAAEEQGVDVCVFVNVPNPLLTRPMVDDYEGRPVVVFKSAERYGQLLAVKRLFDIVGAAVLLLLLSPLWLLLALLVKLTSRGPVLYVQERTGLRGKPFPMLKFRTMRPDAEGERAGEQNDLHGPVFKARNDRRVTTFGRFLRRFSLDELPQLWNVLRGQMSLVGPRPLPVYETRRFEVFRDHRRYSVLPGMTGLWQISGRTDLEDFQDWVRLDLEYIDRWSLALDVAILLRTIPAVLSGRGAR